MHIIYFCQHFSTPEGSGGLRPYEMARRLIHHGHTVTVICGSSARGGARLEVPFVRGKRRGAVEGIDVIEFDLMYSNSDGFIKRTVTFLKYAFRSIGLALTERYDVVFATTTPLTTGIPGIFARWLRNKPFVFEVRDLWPELPREMGAIKNPLVLGLMSILEWASYRSAHRCIGLSPGIVEGIAKRGVNREKISMIPNGCDLDIFGPHSEKWRPEGVSDMDLMAIFTGAHGMANGLGAVLDAAKVLKQRNRNDIKLVLVGQGKFKADLEKRAAHEGLDNVVFHPLENKYRIAGLMSSADLGMQLLANVPAFYFGTSPNKFFDYIASGLPVLNNYPGWLADMIKDNKCGFAIPPEDPEAFADALETAAADRESLITMGKHARALAEGSFARPILADQWVDWVTGASSLT